MAKGGRHTAREEQAANQTRLEQEAEVLLRIPNRRLNTFPSLRTRAVAQIAAECRHVAQLFRQPNGLPLKSGGAYSRYPKPTSREVQGSAGGTEASAASPRGRHAKGDGLGGVFRPSLDSSRLGLDAHSATCPRVALPLLHVHAHTGMAVRQAPAAARGPSRSARAVHPRVHATRHRSDARGSCTPRLQPAVALGRTQHGCARSCSTKLCRGAYSCCGGHAPPSSNVIRSSIEAACSAEVGHARRICAVPKARVANHTGVPRRGSFGPRCRMRNRRRVHAP